MKTLTSVFFSLLVVSLLGCEKDAEPVPEFFISGIIDGKFINYPQEDVADVNVSNTYFPEYEVIHLQANDPIRRGTRGGSIMISNLDLSNILVPYKVPVSEGNIVWFDDRVVEIDERCRGIDQLCSYIGVSGEGMEIIITNVDGDIISGSFRGRLLLRGVAFSPFIDDSKFIDIKNGIFKFRYKTDAMDGI